MWGTPQHVPRHAVRPRFYASTRQYRHRRPVRADKSDSAGLDHRVDQDGIPAGNVSTRNIQSNKTNAPISISRLRLRMIRREPPQRRHARPPRRIALVTGHEHVPHDEPLFLVELRFDFLDAARDDGEGREALLGGEAIVAPVGEIAVADVDGNVLWWKGKVSECVGGRRIWMLTGGVGSSSSNPMAFRT